VKSDRREFVGATAAALAVAGSGIGTLSKAKAMNAAALKQVDAGVLNVSYLETGPASGPPVILFHGWPYDVHAFDAVAPILAAAGHRVIVPYLRGYGPTRFLAADTVRNGQPAALAMDAADLMDALKIERAVLAGFDWGARTADIVAALWPERVKALVAVSGYLIGSQAAGKQPLPPSAELQWWYQYYFATERGRLGYEKNRHDFNKLIWQLASPKWAFDDATYDRSAAAFDNPDHVAIVVHNYRWRLGLAEGEPRYDAIEQRPGNFGPDNHHGGRCQRRPASAARSLSRQIHRQVRASQCRWRDRTQFAAGSAARIRPGGDRCRQALSPGARGQWQTAMDAGRAHRPTGLSQRNSPL
jgi:pimeloyl-ACP methyl ester carboxylesterase